MEYWDLIFVFVKLILLLELAKYAGRKIGLIPAEQKTK